MRLLVCLAALLFAPTTVRADPKADRAALDIRSLDKAVEFFKTKRGNYPDKLQDLITAGYVDPKTTLLDPWGNEYKYDPKGKRQRGKKPDLWAIGSDKSEIGNWPTNEKE